MANEAKRAFEVVASRFSVRLCPTSLKWSSGVSEDLPEKEHSFDSALDAIRSKRKPGYGIQ